ncbi:MAG: SDR family oxidoreductase [Betaproteobacteria bacterium]|nr:SDR family oxidoreductase [Betaproteobacteria bacterium]
MNESRVAVVIGGGTGIGRACAEVLVERGWSVCCFGRDRDTDWPEVIPFAQLDVTDDAALAAVAAKFPRLDALVNSAGIILHEGQEFEGDGFRRVIDVNLIGTERASVLFRDALATHGGAIVNVASVWSSFGSARNPAYSASKGAVVSLTRSHAVAFAPLGVRVNAVAPGWIETRLSERARTDPARSSAITQRIPMGRWGEPRDVGDVVAFLVSEESRYVTGAVIPVDGGYCIA